MNGPRQIVIAMTMYADEFDGHLPYGPARTTASIGTSVNPVDIAGSTVHLLEDSYGVARDQWFCPTATPFVQKSGNGWRFGSTVYVYDHQSSWLRSNVDEFVSEDVARTTPYEGSFFASYMYWGPSIPEQVTKAHQITTITDEPDRVLMNDTTQRYSNAGITEWGNNHEPSGQFYMNAIFLDGSSRGAAGRMPVPSQTVLDPPFALGVSNYGGIHRYYVLER
jgi:hypothetical protein